MKKSLLFLAEVLIFILTVVVVVNAQGRNISINKAELVKESLNVNRKLGAIPGSMVLYEQEKKITEYVRKHPEILEKQRRAKPTSWNFNIGDTHTWWATNMSTSTEYEVESTCRAVGVHCYVFVEDSQWINGGNGRVNQAAVDSIKIYFDSQTPQDPNKGIYETDVKTFGTPPDFDNDPKIVILVLDIQDAFTPGSGWVGGYFFSINQYPDLTFTGRRSNEAEIYYIDSDPTDLNDNDGLSGALSTTAHEFQHMIHWGKDQFEMTFIDEGCATVAEVVCGFPIYTQSGFINNPNRHLFEWALSSSTNVFQDYARAARWTVYLKEQFPNNYLRKLVAETEQGIQGINEALKSYTPSTSRRFRDIFEDWCIANYLNDKNVDNSYGYDYSPLSVVVPKKTYVNPNVSTTQDTVQNLAAQYIRFWGGKNLSITFNTLSDSVVIKALKIGSTVVEDVPLNTEYTVPDYGTTYSEVTFVVINKKRNKEVKYNYTASGEVPQQAQQIAYDDGEPEGYLQLSVGDTIAVIFDGLPGTTLDSVRVAFRRAGTITLGVSRYAAYGSSFIGQELVPPRTVQCFSESPYPYPVPYENWVGVDLTSFEVDAGSDFIVWFEVTNSDAPAVMISVEPDNGDYHSFTYAQDRQQWLRYVDSEGNPYNYLVHSYLGISTAIGEKQLLSFIPDEYSLSQNYPNPFNPTTTIKYGLPEPGQVKLIVYDIKGREVMKLVEEEKEAGFHTVDFDGSRLASGIYFYRLQSKNFQQIRKMMIIK